MCFIVYKFDINSLDIFLVINTVNQSPSEDKGAGPSNVGAVNKNKVDIRNFLKKENIDEKVLISSSMGGNKSVSFVIFNENENIIKTSEFFDQERDTIKKLINYMLDKHNMIKINLISTNTYIETVSQDKRECYFHGGYKIEISKFGSVEKLLNHLKKNLSTNESNFQLSSSCLSMYSVEYLELDLHAFNPTFYGADDNFEIDQELINCHCLMNIKNDTNKSNFCFISCVLSSRHWWKFACKKQQRRLSTYLKYEKKLNLEQMQFPVSEIVDINLFVKNNPLYSIDIYEYVKPKYDFENAKIEVIRKTKKT